MRKEPLYLSGALAGIVFFAAVFTLATMVPGYSHVAQTVSEIGRLGSPAETHFRVANVAVALCLLAFSRSLYRFAKDAGASGLPAYFTACYALSQLGMAIFPSPHSLHNVFGLSMIAGYMAPLALATAWRKIDAAASLLPVSRIATALIVVAIALNLSPLLAPGLYPLEYYGLIQRFLLVAFFGWCFLISMKLFRGR